MMALRKRHPVAIPMSDPPPAAWDELVPDGATGAVFASPQWHYLFAGLTGATEECFVAFEGAGDTPRSVLPVWHFASPTAYRTCDPGIIAGAAPNDPRWFPCTVIEGARGGNSLALLTRDLMSWFELAGVVGQRYPGAICVTHVDTATAAAILERFPHAHAVLAALRSEIALDPAAVCERSWERQLTSLPSKRRCKIRAELRSLQAGERTIEWGPVVDDDIPRIADLMSRTEKKKGSVPSAFLVERWIRQVAHRTRARAAQPALIEPVMFTCRLPDRTIIGGNIGVRYRDTITMRTIGFDYDAVVGEHSEYSTMSIYTPTRYAAEQGLRWVGLGTTAEEAKLSRGARAELEWLVLLRPPAHWGPDETRAINRVRSERWLALGDLLLGRDLAEQLAQVASGSETLGRSALIATG
jgi:hypothetical protein